MTHAEMLAGAELIFRGTVIEEGDTHALIQVDTLWKDTLSSSTAEVERGTG